MASGLGRGTMSENILKQGYLKRSVQSTDLIPSVSKQLAKSIKQKFEPSRWYVFGVRNRIPYLEYFDKEESVFTGPPIHSYDLSTVQNISYTMGRTNTNFTFCIFLAGQAIDITAPSRAHMVDWCRCLERNLRNLGLRSKHQKDEHQYTSFPVKSNYKPTQTLLDLEDNPSSETTLEDQLVLDAQLHSDDEDKEPDYQDAANLRLDDDDDDDDDDGNNQSTLPLRPPPRLPTRDHSNTIQDEVFASISTVRRDEMYRNVESFNQEEHLFDTESDSDSDTEDDNIEANLSAALNKQSAEGNIYEEEEEDRCTSLPNMPNLPQESDTSDDSDFISTSFWLRNRRPDHLDEISAPLVPLRIDSIIPMPKHRECVSMDLDYLRPDGQRSISPSLICLEKAPALPKRQVDERTFVVIDRSTEGDSKENNIVLLENIDWHAVKNSVSSGLEGKISFPNNCDNSQSDDVDGGLYETLTAKPVKPSKLSGFDEPTEDSVYEATWECSSARRCDSDNDDACCGMEPEELIVTLPPENNEKTIQHEHVTMRNYDNEVQSQKHRSVLSKIFSRKSKDNFLPESLVVTIPQTFSGEATGETEEGNLYSDFPTPDQEHTHTVSTGNHLDSDILKLSLLENGPTETSSIELPKRDFNQHPVRAFAADEAVRPMYNLSVSLKEPIQGFNQDAYEPVNLFKSVNIHHHNTWLPAPSPPAKAKHNRTADITTVLEDSPIAPPRRNRKSYKSVNGKSDSPELRRKNNVAGSPSIPKKRQSVLTALSASVREPALPRRNLISPDKEKPAVPPPPRRGVAGREVSDISVGARPKTIHLASRQQSINQSSALTAMNLKQNQVDILRSEIESTGGLVKAVSKVHFQSGLALVECFNKIWIAGWDVKKFPRLYDKFHIGDQLVSINDVQVTDLSFAHKLVKNIKADSMEITIRRLPNARVYAIQRSTEGENLGIKRVGGTADIVYIDPLGLAYRHGLVDKATTIDGTSVCYWTLTEVNMRPLNLFYKDSEIEHRLLAVGRDISIAVQPSDFVKELKKQVKKLKGYKDYLIK